MNSSNTSTPSADAKYNNQGKAKLVFCKLMHQQCFHFLPAEFVYFGDDSDDEQNNDVTSVEVYEDYRYFAWEDLGFEEDIAMYANNDDVNDAEKWISSGLHSLDRLSIESDYASDRERVPIQEISFNGNCKDFLVTTDAERSRNTCQSDPQMKLKTDPDLRLANPPGKLEGSFVTICESFLIGLQDEIKAETEVVSSKSGSKVESVGSEEGTKGRTNIEERVLLDEASVAESFSSYLIRGGCNDSVSVRKKQIPNRNRVDHCRRICKSVTSAASAVNIGTNDFLQSRSLAAIQDEIVDMFKSVSNILGGKSNKRKQKNPTLQNIVGNQSLNKEDTQHLLLDCLSLQDCK